MLRVWAEEKPDAASRGLIEKEYWWIEIVAVPPFRRKRGERMGHGALAHNLRKTIKDHKKLKSFK
jgi:hypothetical protein